MKNPITVQKCDTSTDEVVDQDETAANSLRLGVRKSRESFFENTVLPGQAEDKLNEPDQEDQLNEFWRCDFRVGAATHDTEVDSV